MRAPQLNAPRVLITAGPTHEPIDRVRYIGNRSSGRMGMALANACADRGWPVMLLLGPIDTASVSPPLHTDIRIERFRTTHDLQSLLVHHWPAHDVLFMAAAVADFTIKNQTHEKIKRTSDITTLELSPTPDLLGSLAQSTRPEQITIGFALEPPGDLAREATRKLKAKRVHAIVANPLETMDALDVTATLILADGRTLSPPQGILKEQFAQWLIDQLPTIGHTRG